MDLPRSAINLRFSIKIISLIKFNIKVNSSFSKVHSSSFGNRHLPSFSLHLVLFKFLFAMRHMSLASLLIELPSTPLALNPSIIYFLSRLHKSTITSLWSSSSSHCLSEQLTLLLPLRSLRFSSDSLLFRIVRYFLRWRSWFFLRRLVTVIVLIIILYFSLFLYVKDFALLNKYLLTNLLMFLESLKSKFPSTTGALFSVNWFFTIFFR